MINLTNPINLTISEVENLYNEGYEFELNDGCVLSAVKVDDNK